MNGEAFGIGKGGSWLSFQNKVISTLPCQKQAWKGKTKDNNMNSILVLKKP